MKTIPSLQVYRGQRIGLLGGSFNPSHQGHLHIINLAIKYLQLSKVWCLVSPQNPLKSRIGMSSLRERLECAHKVLKGPSIIVTDIETELLTNYSADTITALKVLYPGAKFIWIMGADNLIQFNKWKNWEFIFESIPIAVFDRPPYSIKAEKSIASRRFSAARLPASQARHLVRMAPPAWIYLRTKLNSLSGTQIRIDKLAAN